MQMFLRLCSMVIANWTKINPALQENREGKGWRITKFITSEMEEPLMLVWELRQYARGLVQGARIW